MLVNLTFDTRPLVVHAQGRHRHKPYWEPIRDRFFASPRRQVGPTPGLTVITWNNGHDAMGLFERSMEHLGAPCLVLGRGVESWVNSQHKPALTAEALPSVDTEFVMGVDSRDAIILDDPGLLLETYRRQFDCDLVFSADRLNWPSTRRFRQFEDHLPGAESSEFRYLNSGAFIGRTEFCRTFFEDAARTPPAPEAPRVDQGVFKQVFQRHHPRVQLDYRCALFQNIGFVVAPILRLE